MTKAERKAFRSQMWAFRRDPESLTTEEQQALKDLFEKIPDLKELYRVRLRFKEIFDTARDRTTAARWLRQLRRETERLGLDLSSFFATYDRWKTEILNYFDAHQTSAAVEGINNKARVITKRAYGLKSGLRLAGYLLTMYDKRLAVHRTYETILRRLYGADVFEAVVPRAKDFVEAVAHRTPLAVHKPKGAAAKSVAALAEELLARVGLVGQAKRGAA